MNNNWNRGRMGICTGGVATQMTFSCCPKTREALVMYCEQTGYIKSEVINDAILSYIQRNQGGENVQK